MSTGNHFAWGKTTRTWSWVFTCTWCRGKNAWKLANCSPCGSLRGRNCRTPCYGKRSYET